jgi:hypothetical protein
LNGKYDGSVAPPSRSGSRCVSQQNNFFSHGGVLDSSFESNPGDVVRIRVPYKKSNSTSPTSAMADLPRYEGNKILITVNHSSLTTPTNSPTEHVASSDRRGSPTKKKSPSPEKTSHSVYRDAKLSSSSSHHNNDWAKSGEYLLL